MEKQKRKGTVQPSAFDALAEYVGEEVSALIKELSQRPDYSEFKLAEALGKEVNATRNLLYKLHSLNLASFIKKKDNKIGWYVYYWTFSEEKVKAFLLNEKKNRYEALTDKLTKEGDGNFYSCASNCARLDFDNAFEFSFRCPECGELMMQDSNAVGNDKAVNEIRQLEKEIGELRIAVELEKTKKEETNENSVDD